MVEEVSCLPFVVEVALKRCFKCKAAHDVELTPKNNPCCFLFGPLTPELAGEEPEHLTLF